MRKLLALAVISVLAVPAAAQTTARPTTAPSAEQTLDPSGQPVKMVKKTICERVDVEETTGSRLGSAPKKCKTIMVPANKAKAERGE